MGCLLKLGKILLYALLAIIALMGFIYLITVLFNLD